ncbi:MAG: SRPBCC domain-containing protein [Polyangiales bacterium]
MIRRSVRLAGDVHRAWSLFTGAATEWWPPSRRHLGDPESEVLIEAAGRFFERARDGREAELGRVTAWEPPDRLEMDFYPGTDAAHPTRVTVTFTADGDETVVEVTHGPGPESAGLFVVRAPAYERSWEAVLSALRERCQR